MDSNESCVNTGSSLSKQEHTVVNVGHPDGPPRLVRTLRPSSPYASDQQTDLMFTDNMRQGIARLRLESGHVFDRDYPLKPST